MRRATAGISDQIQELETTCTGQKDTRGCPHSAKMNGNEICRGGFMMVHMLAPFCNLCYHLTEVYYRLYSDDSRYQKYHSFLTALWLDIILYPVDGFSTPRKSSI